MVSFWRRDHEEVRATSAATWTMFVRRELPKVVEHGAEELAGTLAPLRVTIPHRSETHGYGRCRAVSELTSLDLQHSK